MRVAIYTRVSTSDQSTDMQLARLREYAGSRDWKIVSEFSETESGANINRPLRREILQLARRRQIDVILVWKLDRWGRNTSDLITSLDELAALGVGFVSFTEAIDLTTPIGRAFLGLLAVFAQFERDLIRDRVKAGVARYREKNKTWGRPASAGKFAPVVKHLASQGMSAVSIAREVGISRSSVIRILNQKPADVSKTLA